jgi:hypothetical protein
MQENKRVIVLPTVESTGSRLTASMFRGIYSEKLPGDEVEDLSLFYAHLNKKNIKSFIDLCSKYPTVVPLRHPKRVALSFQDKGRIMELLKEQFDYLIKEIAPLKPLYLRVDSKSLRHQDLEYINKEYNLSLGTIWPYFGDNNWPAVRDDHNKAAIPSEEELETRLSKVNKKFIESYIEENKDFFGRFYAC